MSKAEQILSKVPKEFHATLSYMAYERGHAYGDEEIENILQNLVNDLEPAILLYEARIREELSK